MKFAIMAALLITLFSGPTIPPGPWDEDDSGSGSTKLYLA
jgi:hypothetical protein